MRFSDSRPWRLATFLLVLVVPAGQVLFAQTTGALTAGASTDAAIRPELAAFDSAWNILRSNYVAENNSHVDWDALKAELRPRAESAHSVEEVRGVIREMLARVGQSHFALLPASVASDMNGPALTPGEIGSLGFSVGPVSGRLVVTGVDANGPARAAGVKPGWVVTRVGARDLNAAIGTLSDGSSDHLQDFRLWALGTSLLRGRTGEAAEIGFLDDRDAPVQKQIVRTPEAGVPVKFGHLPTLFARLDRRQIDRNGVRVGLIAFNVWMTAISRPFDEAIDRLRDTRGIVIDLRGNPGGVLTMIMGLSGHFLDSPVNLGVIRTRESSLNLVANPRLVSTTGQNVQPFGGAVAILVDSGSYSASEIFAGGMQAIGRARVFGSRTAGGALPAVLERLPGGDVLQYAIGDFTTATGQRIEGRGVIPDVEVVPTRQALLAGSDPALDAAVDWIAHLEPR